MKKWIRKEFYSLMIMKKIQNSKKLWICNQALLVLCRKTHFLIVLNLDIKVKIWLCRYKEKLQQKWKLFFNHKLAQNYQVSLNLPQYLKHLKQQPHLHRLMINNKLFKLKIILKIIIHQTLLLKIKLQLILNQIRRPTRLCVQIVFKILLYQ